MLSLSAIRACLHDRTALVVDPKPYRHAAVALLVCETEAGPELLFIERSEHERDPWSGHVGFPGGRVEAADPGPKAAAERETLEEVGLDLTESEYLGRLDDLLATHNPVLVSCFVFGMRVRPTLQPNPAEIRQAFWLPLSRLLDVDRHGQRTFHFGGEWVTHPAIRILEDGRPWLWGITLRFVCQFLEAVGHPIAHSP